MTLGAMIKLLGSLMAFSTLGVILYGIWRGSQRQVGRTSGHFTVWLRSAFFYMLATAIFISLAWLGWRPLPLVISPQTHAVMQAIGSLFFFPGMGLVLWGRLTLGRNYFISTGLGAQLFVDQQLIKTGPYAIVRHPMYAGLMMASIGGLLIYTTWTTVYFVLFAPFLALRMRREEQALAAEFGNQWQDYCRQVPALFPHLRNKFWFTINNQEHSSRKKVNH